MNIQRDLPSLRNQSLNSNSMGSSEDYESAEDEAEETEDLINSAASEVSASSYASAQKEKWRNLVAYWFLGLTNNFAYVIMLSAAHDILSEDFGNAKNNPNVTGSDSDNNGSVSNPRDCNMLSTGTVLLADIIPSLVVKVLAPFVPLLVHGSLDLAQGLACAKDPVRCAIWTWSLADIIPSLVVKVLAPFVPLLVHFRIAGVVVLCTVSFLVVGLAVSSSMALLGVVFASASAGLGETTFLAYSSYYHQDVVSTWSSGTGGAGLFGALSYAGLTSLGLTPKQSILLMLIVPIIMSLSFWKILEHPPHMRCSRSFSTLVSTLRYDPMEGDQLIEQARPSATSSRLTLDEKCRFLPSLFKYMIPLSSVYVAEYLINQGLSELVYFPNAKSWITHEQQYRWYQVLYQVGVLISRSSVNLVYIRKIWITSVLQWLNVLVFLTAAIYWWFGSIWVAFTLILWEGLLGGAAYVNTFYRLSKEVAAEEKEFAIQATSMSDTFGVTIAGFIAIPLHNAICNMPL